MKPVSNSTKQQDHHPCQRECNSISKYLTTIKFVNLKQFPKIGQSPTPVLFKFRRNWLSNHRDNFIAKGKTCNNFGLMNHFAKVCRKQKYVKPKNPKKRTVNSVDEEPHPEDSVIFLQLAKLYESDYSTGKDKTVALIQNDFAKKPLNMPNKIGNISTTLLLDSGSACSIFNCSIASQVMKSSPHAFWIHEDVSPHFSTFWNEPIRIEGKIRAPVTRIVTTTRNRKHV